MLTAARQRGGEPEPGPDAAPPVALDHVTVRYGRRVALRDVSATMWPGSFIGVIGPNGAGKSTLLKAILGIVPLSGGEVRIFGRSIADGRSRVAYVPQREAVHLDFPVTVFDVALMGRYRQRGWLRLPAQADREIAREALAQVTMLDRAHDQIGQLSGGQQQRVFLARALAQQADVLLLDEPLNGVDARTQETLLEIVEQLRGQGKTIVMATHDLNMAADTCDCIACVNHNLIAYGPAGDAMRPDVLERTYGGNVLVINRDNLGAERRAAQHAHQHDHQHQLDLEHALQHVHPHSHADDSPLTTHHSPLTPEQRD
ncbi:MAG: metal ABC transporter ATP-binding protein [Dehalococcoidia bacterium]